MQKKQNPLQKGSGRLKILDYSGVLEIYKTNTPPYFQGRKRKNLYKQGKMS